MKKYKIEITETLQKVVEVEAENLRDAIIDVGTQYGCGEIVLTDTDFASYEIEEFKE